MKVAYTPGPKGKVAGVRDPPPKPRCPQDHPAWSRQLKVLSSLASELGKSTRSSLHLDTNQACRRENASGRCGRRRRRSSQTISCNGIYRAKVRQGNNNDVTGRMVNGMPAVASKQGPTDHTGKADVRSHATWFPGASLGHKNVWSAPSESRSCYLESRMR